MKILFLNPPFIDIYSRTVRRPAVDQGNSLFYPIWLAYAAAVAEKAGNDVRLFDAPFDGLQLQGLHQENDILGPYTEFHPDIVVMDTSSYSIHNDGSVAQKIKSRYPDAFIVMVGTYASAEPKNVLRKAAGVDSIAFGEYEYSIIELSKALKRKTPLESIDGIVFRQDKNIIQNKKRKRIQDLDEIPFVSRIYKKYLTAGNYYYNGADYPLMMIITSRGCPYQCPYCVNPQLMHSKDYYARSAENVVDEFEYILENFSGIKEIGIEDDCFTVDKDRVIEICEALIKRKIKMKWHCNARPDLDPGLLKLMKQAGCRLISVGFESSSQDVLNNIGKKIQVADYPQFMKNAKQAGILVKGCFMLGNPGDTRETMKQSYQFSKNMNCDFIRFYPLYLYPGTWAFNMAQKKGYLKKDAIGEWLGEDSLHDNILQCPSFLPEELVFLSEKYRNRYFLSSRYLFGGLLASVKNNPKRKIMKDMIRVSLKNFVNELMHKSR